MKPTEKMIEAGLRTIDRALWKMLRPQVTRTLTAAMPLIEQAVAEQIAQRIEAEIEHAVGGRVDGLDRAITIAREYGEEQSND